MNIEYKFNGLKFKQGNNKSELYPLSDIQKSSKFSFLLNPAVLDTRAIDIETIKVKSGIDFIFPEIQIEVDDKVGDIINRYLPYMLNQYIIFETNYTDLKKDKIKNLFIFIGIIEKNEMPLEVLDFGKGLNIFSIKPHYYYDLISPSPAKYFPAMTTNEIIKDIFTKEPYNIPETNFDLDIIDNKGDWIKLDSESDLEFIKRIVKKSYSQNNNYYTFKFWIDLNDKINFKSLDKVFKDTKTKDGEIVCRTAVTKDTKFITTNMKAFINGLKYINLYNNIDKFSSFEYTNFKENNIYYTPTPIQKLWGKLSGYEKDMIIHNNIGVDHDLLPKGYNYASIINKKDSDYPFILQLNQDDAIVSNLELGHVYNLKIDNTIDKLNELSPLSGDWILFNRYYYFMNNSDTSNFSQRIIIKRSEVV